MPKFGNERGIALAVAIFALVVIGALVAGAFYVGTQEQRIGRNSVLIQQAANAAEEGAYRQIVDWDPMTLSDIAIDSFNRADSQIPFSGTLPGGERYRGTIRRIEEMLYLINSEGFSVNDLARQRIGVVVRKRPIEVNINAALETQKLTVFGGNMRISGFDSEGDWAADPSLCEDPLPAKPGVRIEDADNVTLSGQPYNPKTGTGWSLDGETTGNPIGSVEEDPTITGEGLTTFGDADWDILRSMATFETDPAELAALGKVLPVGTATSCNRAVKSNWGEPALPGTPIATGTQFIAGCQDYFPIVYIRAGGPPGCDPINQVGCAAHLTQARGQGVLLVEGDLVVTGMFEFYGPVIIRGALITAGGGKDPAHFYGGIIAARVNSVGEDNSLLGRAQVFYSSCAISRALAGSAKVWPLRERSWASMY